MENIYPFNFRGPDQTPVLCYSYTILVKIYIIGKALIKHD